MRKRGYIVFTAVVLAAVLLLVLLPKQEPRPVPAAVAEADSLAPSPSEATPRAHRSRPPGQRYAAAGRPAEAAQTVSAAAPASATTPATASVRDRRTHVALNSGDTLDWQQLHNIGPAFARRIVRYRALLGGFVRKEQLLEVYGMDSARYLGIAPYIDPDSAAVERLDINSATIDQLKHHPYLDYYQAKAIVRLREKESSYQSVSDLRRVPVIDQETYNKILPYITCNSQPNR